MFSKFSKNDKKHIKIFNKNIFQHFKNAKKFGFYFLTVSSSSNYKIPNLYFGNCIRYYEIIIQYNSRP